MALAEESLVLARLAERLRTIGHPVRIQIIGLIRERERCVGEIAESLDLPTGAISHHLKVMERAGLLIGKESTERREVCERLHEQFQAH